MKIEFPQFPEKPIFLAYFDGLDSTVLATVKAQLLRRNDDYDYCFLSTTHLVSFQQLRSCLYTAVRNLKQDTMNRSSVNTEIIFSLSPVNNINDSLKRFGIDETRSDIVVVKVCSSEEDMDEIEKRVGNLLGTSLSVLTDEVLFSRFDASKFKKLFKLQGVETQADLTQGATESSLLRGL